MLPARVACSLVTVGKQLKQFAATIILVQNNYNTINPIPGLKHTQSQGV